MWIFISLINRIFSYIDIDERLIFQDYDNDYYRIFLKMTNLKFKLTFDIINKIREYIYIKLNI